MDHRVEAVITVMTANLAHRHSVAELATAVHISSAHLRRLFKAQTGFSLARYLKQLRLARAKELLETTYFSVKEIAALVGVDGVSHFVRDFEREYHITPARHNVDHHTAKQSTKRSRRNAKIG